MYNLTSSKKMYNLNRVIITVFNLIFKIFVSNKFFFFEKQVSNKLIQCKN